MQNRLKSTALWVAVASQILGILVALGVIDIGASTTVNTVIVAACQILTTVGILNNPTNPESF
jgi:uncharacterized membrane protein